MQKQVRCDGKTEVYSRVVGYYRPVKNWNKGKQEEFAMRKTFKLDGNTPLCEVEEPEEESSSLSAFTQDI